MSADDKFFLRKRYLFWITAIIGLCFVFYKVKDVLLPFYIAFFITILFNGIVSYLEKKLKIPRAISAGIITLLFCGFVIYIISAIVPLVYSKATTSYYIARSKEEGMMADIIKSISGYFSSFSSLNFAQVADFIEQNITKEIAMFIKGGIFNIFHSVSALISLLVLFALSPIVVFMMLKDMPKIQKKFFSILPKQWQGNAHKLFGEMYDSVFKFLEGQSLASLVLSIIYSIMLYFVGSNHFILLGFIIGFSAFIPYVGFYSAVILTLFSIYGEFHSVNIVAITFALLLAGQILDSGFVTPKLVGDKLGVHPLWIIFGVLVSVPLFGVFGILLALPMVGLASVLIKFCVREYKTSSYYKT